VPSSSVPPPPAQADKDAARFADLLARGSVDRMHAEQMQLAAVSARSQAVQAAEQIHQAEAAVAEARPCCRNCS
jgi:HlyD family secretion protein